MRRNWYLRNRDSQIAAASAYQAANPEKAIEWNRKAIAKGRERYNAQRLARYYENRVEVSAARKDKYRADADWRAKLVAAAAQRRSERPEDLKRAARDWRRANPERVRAAWDAWKERNPETARVAAVLGQQRRRARVRSLPSKLDQSTWGRVLHYYGECCAYCFRPLERLTVDHIIPVSRGGTNEEENLAPGCQPCNSSKGNRTPLEYLAGIRLT